MSFDSPFHIPAFYIQMFSKYTLIIANSAAITDAAVVNSLNMLRSHHMMQIHTMFEKSRSFHMIQIIDLFLGINELIYIGIHIIG